MGICLMQVAFEVPVIAPNLFDHAQVPRGICIRKCAQYFVKFTGQQLYSSGAQGREHVVTLGHWQNSCWVFLISPTLGVASLTFTGLILGSIDTALQMCREQEKQLDVIVSESRKDVWCPTPSDPIEEGTPCWCLQKAPFGLLALLFLSSTNNLVSFGSTGSCVWGALLSVSVPQEAVVGPFCSFYMHSRILRS